MLMRGICMTVQLFDSIKYIQNMWSIYLVQNEQSFFNINDYKIYPAAYSSACWRGYVAQFCISTAGQLFLHRLSTNNDSLLSDTSKTGFAKKHNLFSPKINGKQAIDTFINETKEYSAHIVSGGPLFYNSLNLATDYTGSIIIVRGKLFSEINNGMFIGFLSCASFKFVSELIFIKGKLSDVNELSETAALMRKTINPFYKKHILINEDCFSENWIERNRLIFREYKKLWPQWIIKKQNLLLKKIKNINNYN